MPGERDEAGRGGRLRQPLPAPEWVTVREAAFLARVREEDVRDWIASRRVQHAPLVPRGGGSGPGQDRGRRRRSMEPLARLARGDRARALAVRVPGPAQSPGG